MTPVQFPLAFGHWLVKGDVLVCRMPRKTLTIAAPQAVLSGVMELCDGRLGWKAVASTLARNWSRRTVEGFMSALAAAGALVEAGEALARWSDAGQLPNTFAQPGASSDWSTLAGPAHESLPTGSGVPLAGGPQATALVDLLRRRQSYRTFGDRAIQVAELCSILWAAHGVARPALQGATRWHRTVGSGGNVHSTRWFVIVLRPLPADAGAGDIAPGLYEARFHQGGGASLQPAGGRADDAWRVLADPRPLTFASALIIPVSDTSLASRRYGNRATLFAQVEWGQSLQNAQLMAAALDVAGIVRGDTLASEVLAVLGRAALDSPPAQTALVSPSLLVGAMPSAAEVALQQQRSWIKISQAARAPSASDSAIGAQVGFAFTAGPLPLEEGLYTSGRSGDPRLALVKAEAESWERLGWITLGSVVEGACDDLPGTVDPGSVAAYTAAQYSSRAFPFTPFSPSRVHLWKRGVEVHSARQVLMLAECVHALASLPPEHQAAAYTNTSTSGVAAWTDEEGALCRATLELLERDAFLRSWLPRLPRPLLAMEALPGPSRTRVQALQDSGHEVGVARLDAMVAAYAVFIQHSQRSFTAITAAADFDPEAALAKALDEAEGRAAHVAAFPCPALLDASKIGGVEDVGRFYRTPRHFRKSDFYVQGPRDDAFLGDNPGCSSWLQLKAGMADRGMPIHAVEITPPDAAIHQGRTPLRVVRAIVPSLIPIWFGHGLQPQAHPAFVNACAKTRPAGSRSTVFVHPFT